MRPHDLFEKIYKPVHSILMNPKTSQNYHFVMLHLIHQKFITIAPLVIEFLTEQITKNEPTELNKIGCLGINLALINSMI